MPGKVIARDKTELKVTARTTLVQDKQPIRCEIENGKPQRPPRLASLILYGKKLWYGQYAARELPDCYSF